MSLIITCIFDSKEVLCFFPASSGPTYRIWREGGDVAAILISDIPELGAKNK